jgi:hypothetical protein
MKRNDDRKALFLGHGTKHALYFQVTWKMIRCGTIPFGPTKALQQVRIIAMTAAQEAVQRSIMGELLLMGRE